MVNSVVVVVAAIMSEIGSAKNTAIHLSAVNIWGRMKISGMSRIILRSTARKIEYFALPIAIKVD